MKRKLSAIATAVLLTLGLSTAAPAQDADAAQNLTLHAGKAFAFGAAELNDTGKARLEAIMDFIEEIGAYRIGITGHTDHIGDEAYNLDLSQRRAEAAKAHLVEAGVSADQITVEAKGSQDPIVTCEGLEGDELIACLAPNRRTEIRFVVAEQASAEPEARAQMLFTNVNIFNGTDNQLHEGQSVLVEGNLIKAVDRDINAPDAIVIDGGGRTLMPGLIDGHAHVMINANFIDVETNMDITDISYRATRVAERFLMDGFTAVRDMGGPTFGLQRNIDAGFIVGPRIYPSGAFISQTSGHGDFRERSDAGFSINDAGDLSNFERMGIGTVVDGIPAVLAATRLNLRNGASQIKIMAGGGGSSRFDPIDTTQYSIDETCAAVEAAKDWGTYVGAHVFTDRAVNRLLDCGAKSFEHSFFISEKTMQRIAKEGGYVVPQMWGISPDLARNPLMPKYKIPEVQALGKQYKDFGRNLLKHKVKVVFASDYVGAFPDAERARRYELWWRTQTFDSNFEVLRQLTSTAGKLLALSGPRNPYKDGNQGVIEAGAYADLLLVDGNPLEDISVIGGTDKWFDANPEYKPIETLRIIMKDGVIYKNTL